ncbi:hypothetical protein [Streptomyces sp. t39]|nr:hypothetical protein [Streptomyces sp. t39]
MRIVVEMTATEADAVQRDLDDIDFAKISPDSERLHNLLEVSRPARTRT